MKERKTHRERQRERERERCLIFITNLNTFIIGGHLYYNMERLRGFSIRVSSDTNEPPPQSTCYTDQGNVQRNITTEAECERIARYIWIYQSNKADRDRCPMLEICEVQIFGM